jgi:hypothetical protein
METMDITGGPPPVIMGITPLLVGGTPVHQAGIGTHPVTGDITPPEG